MNRRELIAGLGAAAAAGGAWPRAVVAQQRARIPHVGIIDDAEIWDAFRKELQKLGYIGGQNIVFDYQVAEGNPERLAAAAAELARLPVDVIATFGTPASRAAKAATSRATPFSVRI